MYENTVNHLRERYLDHWKKPGLDNVVMIVRKLTSKDNDKYFDYLYYIGRIQRHTITTKWWLLQE